MFCDAECYLALLLFSRWRELNTTTHWLDVERVVRPLSQSLPLLLLHKKAVVGALLAGLVPNASPSLPPLFALLVAAARDLQEEMLPLLPDVWERCGSVRIGGMGRGSEVVCVWVVACPAEGEGGCLRCRQLLQGIYQKICYCCCLTCGRGENKKGCAKAGVRGACVREVGTWWCLVRWGCTLRFVFGQGAEQRCGGCALVCGGGGGGTQL